MNSNRDPHGALGKAIIRLSGAETIMDSTARAWASITFSGLRHRFTVQFGGPEAAAQARAMAASISCDEFDIAGHLVADIITNEPIIQNGCAIVNVEALTVEAV